MFPKRVNFNRLCCMIKARNCKRNFYTIKTELPPLVTGEWLETQLQRENVKIVDGSYHLPSAERDPAKEFSQERIPGAVFFDIDEIADKKSKFKHMMPSKDNFEVAMSQLGICHDDIIVIYDTTGIFSAPRVWYTFKTFGAKNVHILDGGYPLWKLENRKIETGEMTGGYQYERKAFSAKDGTKNSIIDLKGIHKILMGVQKDITIVDARHFDRFTGKQDAGPGLRSGHMPGAYSLFYKRLLTPDGYKFKSVNELKQEFINSKIDINEPIVTTCGSGVTAAIINFAIHLIQYNEYSDDNNFPKMTLYDGSWAEYGSRTDTPIKKIDPTLTEV
mmetsp:Transcript_47696/g.58633  ORF Transcript_47696/g.58633 Transcript_47696/m.58633 type:complete len:332 (+) Transcript_47696:40-1035(+)